MSLPSSLTALLSWLVACILLHVVLGVWLFKGCLNGYANLTKFVRHQGYNRGVSTAHAATMFFYAVYYWLALNPQRAISASILPYEGHCIDIMIGYLIYDTAFEMYMGGEPSSSSKKEEGVSKRKVKNLDTLAHHVLGLVSHITARATDSGAASFYLMAVYLAEASTPSLNVSWLLLKLGRDQGKAFPLVAGSVLVLFLFFRVILGPYMLYHMYIHQTAWQDEQHPYGEQLLYLNAFIVSAFVVLNNIWFYKLIMLATSSSKAKEKQEQQPFVKPSPSAKSD